MNPIEETVEKPKEETEYFKKNKEELVETIASESDLDVEKNREMIERTIENMYLEEKFRNKESSTELEPSLIEDIKSTLINSTPSRGVAKVTNVVEVRDGILELTFSIRGVDDQFTERFYHDDNSRNAISSVRPREDLERLYKLAKTDITNPTDIIGKSVPVKPEKSGYSINYPPSEPGLGRRIFHHTLRRLPDDVGECPFLILTL